MQRVDGMRGERRRPGRREIRRGGRTGENAGQKRQIPCAKPFPVVGEELDPARRDGRADMAEIAGDPEWFVTEQQQGRHDEADERSGHEPRKGMWKHARFWHRRERRWRTSCRSAIIRDNHGNQHGQPP